MTIVSNDPAWLPYINTVSLISYLSVLSSAAVVYDWEFELVWRQRWSFVTVLYICPLHWNTIFCEPRTMEYPGLNDRRRVSSICFQLPCYVEHNDCNSCLILYFIWTLTPVVVNAMLGVIMLIRIHAMYGRSKKMLIFLVIVLLTSTITSVITTVMANIGILVEEFILFGSPMCLFEKIDTYQMNLGYESLISTAIWEVLASVLAVWIVIKHFHELRQSPTGTTIGDCIMALTKSHAFYFVAFAVVTCLTLGSLSPNIMFSPSVGAALYSDVLQVAQVLQMFVLGPRLILSVREYHAELVARSDEGIGMTTIYFQAGGDALTGGDA
ncbi:hypothetical protein BDR03DRAFT_122509 [Suillus americanus]|nr:hypothetical protein BDR03DRAFT_122509 [Suillus americanus]